VTATTTTTTARVEIESIAAGGDGVGRVGGMVIFVPRTAPGDVASVALRGAKRFARGTLLDIERAGPQRITPPCPHYVADRCGGCQLQHMEYEAQLVAKGGIIADSLSRIGKRDVSPPVVQASDAQWRYRRKLTVHVRQNGHASGAPHSGGGAIAGLHPYDDAVAVFDLHDCPITDARVMAVFSELRPAFDLLPRERALRVSVQLVPDGASVIVSGGRAWGFSDRFFAAVPSVTELWWKPDDERPRRVASRRGDAQAGASFTQVNAGVAARLREHVLTLARMGDPRRIIDAYAGTGATAVPLADDGRMVTAIEWDHDAVAILRDRLRAPSSAIAGRVEEHLDRALPADVVLLNPPRTGLDARVTALLETAEPRPRRVVYVSCDPATLARDLARLPAYRLVSIRAYDMFPQTAHVETVCELVPESA
jgi:23S rRNA (uracil1939-C5)-methyltransferase